MISKRKWVSFFNCALFCIAMTFSVYGQQNDSSLSERNVTICLENRPFREIVQLLMVKYEIPIGFEESTLDSNHVDYMFRTALPYENDKTLNSYSYFVVKHNWFSLNFENGKLKDVLDVLVEQMKNYQWEITDGVVNIFPIDGRDKRYEKLLDLKISSFSVPSGDPVFEIRNKILELPEFKRFLKENNLYSSESRSFARDMGRPLPQELKFENITFKELLNKITKIKGGGWILKKNHLFGSEEKEYIEVDI